MKRINLDKTLTFRVSHKTKQMLQAEVDVRRKRGEGTEVSDVVREALIWYLDRHTKEDDAGKAAL